MPNISTYVTRLKPGADLKKSIQSFVVENNLAAAWISCCVGSLVQYNIRFANHSAGTRGAGHFEIVSLAGTLSVHGSHLHIGISDSKGQMTGGHLLDGCIIYTTAEIVILSTMEFELAREKDEETGWNELKLLRP